MPDLDRRRPPIDPARRVVIGTVALLLTIGLAGCGKKSDFEDRTAVVTIAGKATTFKLDTCGLDGQTAFVVGRATNGSVLQAVIGVKKDHKTGVPASTGISVTADPNSVSAFGAESWSRRGETGAPPGTVTSARIRGSRIQASALAQPVDSSDQVTNAPTVDLSLDARCDDQSKP